MKMETERLAWESMRAGIDGQVALLEEAPGKILQEARRTIAGAAPTKIYLVGCGDSHFCGVALRYLFERTTSIPTEALESLEFSRYAVTTAPEGSLVIGVSNSGEVARTVECLQVARRRSLRTIGITYNPQSRLAEAAESTFTYDYRDVGFGPGTMSYMASLLTLHGIAHRIGELAGTITSSDADAAVEEVTALAPLLHATIAASEAPTKAAAASIELDTKVFVIGGGPNYGTALFGMAKMIESARHSTVSQQLEEWAHEQYFVCEEGTLTIVIAPPGASLDRAREQMQAIRDMKGTCAVICAQDDEETAALADWVFPVVGRTDEDLSPMLYVAALELFAMNFAIAQDRVMLGFDDPFRKEVNFRQIFQSRLLEGDPRG